MQFVFDRSFDTDLTPANKPAPKADAPIYTKAEFDAAVKDAARTGYEDGRTSGRAEANSATQQSETERQLATLEAIPPALKALFDDADAHHAVLEAQLLQFVLSVFERLAPDVFTALARSEAEREVKNAIRMALGSATLKVHLPPETVKETGDEVLRVSRLNGYGGRVDVKSDPELITGDVRVTWDHGVMEYSFNDICQRVLTSLRSSTDAATSATHPTEQTDRAEAGDDE